MSGAPTSISRRRTIAGLVLAGVLAVAGIGGVAASSRVTPRQATPAEVAVTTSHEVVCPAVHTAGTYYATAVGTRVGVAAVGGQASDRNVPVTGRLTDAMVLTPVDGQPGGAVIARPSATSVWAASCPAPLAHQLVQVPDAAKAELVLINPQPRGVTVNLTLTAGNGQVAAPGARGITMTPGSTQVVPLSVLASAGALSIAVDTDAGSVVAVARSIGSGGGDLITGTVEARRLVMAAVPAGSGATTLLIANPGTERATVDVSALTRASRLSLAGAQHVVVEAQHTVRVELAAALRGELAALQISSDRPVSATTVSTRSQDWAAGVPVAPAPVWRGIVPAAGTLLVANPGDRPASVRVNGTSAVTIASGTSLPVAVQDAGAPVSVESNQPVTAAIVLTSGGVATLPLAIGTNAASGATRVKLSQHPSLR